MVEEYTNKPAASFQASYTWTRFLYSLPSYWLLALPFDTEDGGSAFLRNIDELLSEYTALYARRKYSFFNDVSYVF
jgi:hypothetical protein